MEGGETSREDGSERSVGGFRLAREHVSDAGGGEDGGRKHSVLMEVYFKIMGSEEIVCRTFGGRL